MPTKVIMVAGASKGLPINGRITSDTFDVIDLLKMAAHTFRVKSGNAPTLIIVARSRVSHAVCRVFEEVLSDTRVILDDELIVKEYGSLLDGVSNSFRHTIEVIQKYDPDNVILIPGYTYVPGFQVQAVRWWLNRQERPFMNSRASAGIIDVRWGTFEDATQFPFVPVQEESIDDVSDVEDEQEETEEIWHQEIVPDDIISPREWGEDDDE